MKFLANKSLKQLALYLAAAFFFLLFLEFLVIRGKLNEFEKSIEKKEFARGSQLHGQQLSSLVNRLGANELQLAPEIYAHLNEQENRLRLLINGGRIPETNFFVDPLSRLPRITFENLYSNWLSYREDVKRLIIVDSLDTQPTEAVDTVATITADSAASNAADSLAIEQTETVSTSTPKITTRLNAEVNKLLPGQWLVISNWYDRLIDDLSDEANDRKAILQQWFFFSFTLDIVLLCVLFYFFNKHVITPIRKVTSNSASRVQDLGFANNEIGGLTREINEILEQLKDATDFVAAIGEGKLDFDYKTLDAEYAEGKNKLADSLIAMQGKLKTLNEEEQRRQWANEGLTKFVDILRSSNDNISQLSDKIISALVKYTNSNQGGLYILNDDDERNKFLELVSIFAFDIKKFEKQRLKLGEGILGQTFLEKETTVLNDVPQEYIRITSGLGSANPKSLLIVPLKVDKDVYGIVELASFRNYEAHEIAFVERLAETIASTLASVKVAQKNRQLIEQFQQQTEEMRSQEEEMRQNMEELQATQEELARKEQDYIQTIETLETRLAKVDLGTSQSSINEQEYQFKIRSLEQKLEKMPTKADDWAVAEEVERTLRFQIEALKIMEEETGKTGNL
jgi:putative methionine-R-sulfoxide reductase with GAF domain